MAEGRNLQWWEKLIEAARREANETVERELAQERERVRQLESALALDEQADPHDPVEFAKSIVAENHRLARQRDELVEAAGRLLIDLEMARGDEHDEGDDMCPNCVTPWKCNGPHITGEDQVRTVLQAIQHNPAASEGE